MSYLDAVLLGIIQGLTEFLPISSSGHLVIVQGWLGLQQNSPEMLAFDVVCHLGTLLAVIVVFWRPFRKMLASRKYALRILTLALTATIVTGAIGLAFKDQFESLFTHTRLVGVAFILTGLLLFIAERVPRGHKGWRRFGWMAAGMVGLAQAVAITPGISRSGATICIAMMLGLRRRWAAQFSFLIAAPAIVGASLIKLKDLFGSETAPETSIDFGPTCLGGIVAAVVGFFAILALLKMLQRSRLHWFSYYVWILGLWFVIRGS